MWGTEQTKDVSLNVSSQGSSGGFSHAGKFTLLENSPVWWSWVWRCGYPNEWKAQCFVPTWKWARDLCNRAMSILLPPNSGGYLGSLKTRAFIFMKRMQHLVSSLQLHSVVWEALQSSSEPLNLTRAFWMAYEYLVSIWCTSGTMFSAKFPPKRI